MSAHPSLILAAAIIAESCLNIVAQTPEIVLHSFSPAPESAAISIRPNTTGWVLVEVSPDLTSWLPLVNLLTTNSTGPFVDYPPANSPVRFYRVRSPGVTAAEAVSIWSARKPQSYQYRFENFKAEPAPDGGLFAGTVTVSNGVKTVTDVTAGGLPITDFSPTDFLTPEEVLALIGSVEQQGAKLAHVTYDPQWGFPAGVTIVFGGSLVRQYSASDFRAVEGAANPSPEPTAAGSSVCGGARRFAAPSLRRHSISGGCGSAQR